MAKRKSKRISRRTILSAARKVRENFRKQRKLNKKQEMDAVKVPRAFLLTDAEKEQIKQIKEDTKARTAEHQAEEGTDVAPHIAELMECIQTCDLFVEVVDYRDIVSGHSRKCGEMLAKSGKKLLIYLSHFSDHFNTGYEKLEDDNTEIVRDYSVFDSARKVCVFGNPKSGKFVLTKEITSRNPEAVVRRITTPTKKATLSDVMRNAADEKCIDSIVHFKEIYPFIDKTAIMDFYVIGTFGSWEGLLTALGRKFSGEQRPRRCMEAGALRFIKDIKDGRILWARTSDQFMFKFTTQ